MTANGKNRQHQMRNDIQQPRPPLVSSRLTKTISLGLALLLALFVVVHIMSGGMGGPEMAPREGDHMRLSKLAAFCFGLGLFIGGAASAGLLVGFEPSRLPPALLDIAAYKLAFIASFALFGVGAVLTRHARREDRERGTVTAAEAPAGSRKELNAENAAEIVELAARQRERDRV